MTMVVDTNNETHLADTFVLIRNKHNNQPQAINWEDDCVVIIIIGCGGLWVWD